MKKIVEWVLAWHIMNKFTRKETLDYCCYYRAEVSRPYCWFVIAVLKSFDNVSLNRTFDREHSVVEFFVPADMEPHFLSIIKYLQEHDYIHNAQKLPNRLSDPAQKV
ncbi:MAG: hypothetical protein Q8Q25_00515 [bacterium]|nr:hypothetical protein [bacterium]